MSTIRTFLNRFQHDTAGATAIEYALIASLISIGIIAGASKIGSNVSSTLNQVAGNMTK